MILITTTGALLCWGATLAMLRAVAQDAALPANSAGAPPSTSGDPAADSNEAEEVTRRAAPPGRVRVRASDRPQSPRAKAGTCGRPGGSGWRSATGNAVASTSPSGWAQYWAAQRREDHSSAENSGVRSSHRSAARNEAAADAAPSTASTTTPTTRLRPNGTTTRQPAAATGGSPSGGR